MRITRITTAVIEANFDYVFVRIESDEGVTGTGECFASPGITGMIRDFGKVLIGCDPLNRNVALGRLFALTSGFGGAYAGMAYNAVSGLDAALWDLGGRAAGVPVSAMLGGMVVPQVRVYADLHAGDRLESVDRTMRYRTPFWVSESGTTEDGAFYFEAPEGDGLDLGSMVASARAAVRDGFRAVKFDLDVFREKRHAGDRSASRDDVRRIGDVAEGLRDALGNDVEIAFDCHWRFDVPSAVAIADAIAPMRPLWLEDPTPPTHGAFAAVASQTAVPLATGENTYLVQGFEDLVASGGVTILQPDMQKTGGLTEAAKILSFAERRFLPVAPHCIAGPLGLMASAHVCSTANNVTALEFHGADLPFWNELVLSERPVIENGVVRIPDRPGIGVDLNDEVARKYASRSELYFGESPA